MAKSLMVTGSAASGNITQGNIRYFICANAPLVANATEAETQITYHTPGVLSMMRVRVNTNSLASGEAVLSVRKDTGDPASGPSITIAAGAGTGDFEDTTNSVAVADGSVMNYKLDVHAAASGNINISNIAVVFNATTDTAVRHAACNFATQTNANTTYCGLSDDGSTLDLTGGGSSFDCNSAGTINKLYVYVSAMPVPPPAFTSTITTAVGGSATTLSVAPTGTGVFEDTSSPATVAANDDVLHQNVTTGVGSIVLEIVSVEWTSTNKKFHSMFARAGAGMGNIGFGATRYYAVGGGGGTASTEPSTKTKMRIAATATNLTTYVAANTIVA